MKKKSGALQYKKKTLRIEKKNQAWRACWLDSLEEVGIWSEGDVLVSFHDKIKRVESAGRYMRFGFFVVFVVLVGLFTPSIRFQSQAYAQRAEKTTVVEEVLPSRQPLRADASLVGKSSTKQEAANVSDVHEENLDHVQGEDGVVEVTHVPAHDVEEIEVVRVVSKRSQANRMQSSNASRSKPSKVIPKAASSSRYTQAKRLFVYGEVEKAKRMLDHVSKLSKNEKQLLAEIYFLECKVWVVKVDIQKALVECQKAYALFQHKKAKQFLEESEKHAKQFYLEGYAVERIDSQKAQQAYLQALLYAPKTSVWKKKALVRMKKYSKQ